MDTLSDIRDEFKETQKLLYNEYYFRNIFKKTEKICAAVFYITSRMSKTTITDELRVSAKQVLSIVRRSLEETDVSHSKESIRLAILDLESVLIMSVSSGELGEDHASVFRSELDLLSRAFTGISGKKDKYERPSLPKNVPKSIESAKVNARNVPSSAGEDVSDRYTKILSILKDIPQSSIKDIAVSFNGLSLKTIQRDLNALIDQGRVRKVGDKRWSRYSIA